MEGRHHTGSYGEACAAAWPSAACGAASAAACAAAFAASAACAACAASAACLDPEAQPVQSTLQKIRRILKDSHGKQRDKTEVVSALTET